ncbi:MAG: ATP-binding cassette domain-containing protein, partial [Firmicutes bacterium]|nr:ATP-binding cassette domain-containing protein [Bacillota bacterium]
MALYLGLDIGTTGCKAGVFTVDGRLIATAYRECSVECPAPGLAEQDVEEVWSAARSVLSEAAAAVADAGEIKALSLSVQGDAVIPVDAEGNPLGPAILGMDRRNLAEVEELAAAVGRERLFAITGMPPHPISSLTKMMWLERHHPRAREVAGYWHYEEFILRRLGGRALTDLSMASRSMAFDLLKKEYSPEILYAAGVARERLAEAVPSGTIAGEIAPEGGRIVLPRNVRIGRLAQEAPEGPQRLIDLVLAADVERSKLLAAAEDESEAGRIAEIHARLQDIGAHAAPARAAAILAGLGFSAEDQQRPCGSFSGGWRMRVALAALLFSQPDLLLLDEPTNYLDLEGTLWLQAFLARYPHTVLIASHDRDLLDHAAQYILHLERGKLALYRGNYSAFARQRAEREARDAKRIRLQVLARKRIEAFVSRFRAKASKARQAQSRLKLLEKLEPISAIVAD